MAFTKIEGLRRVLGRRMISSDLHFNRIGLIIMLSKLKGAKSGSKELFSIYFRVKAQVLARGLLWLGSG